MPIQFRCSNCRKTLSISTKRAGTVIVCPACTEDTLVPAEGDAPAAVAVAPPAAKSTTPPTAKPAAPKVAAPLPPVPAAPKSPLATAIEAANEKKLETNPTAAAAIAKNGDAKPTYLRPPGSAYATGGASKQKPLFDDHDDHGHGDHDDEHDETEHHGQKKKRFMDDTIDMTAMVDVTFLLLIFFMVTASFAAQKVFENSPPEQEGEGGGGAAVTSAEDLATTSVIVEIDANDQMKIEDQPISGLYELRQLLETKRTTENKTELLIQAQYEATHGIVVSVTDAAMEVGMQKVRRISRKTDD